MIILDGKVSRLAMCFILASLAVPHSKRYNTNNLSIVLRKEAYVLKDKFLVWVVSSTYLLCRVATSGSRGRGRGPMMCYAPNAIFSECVSLASLAIHSFTSMVFYPPPSILPVDKFHAPTRSNPDPPLISL